MKEHSRAMRVTSLVVLACFLQSCGTVIPAQFATLGSVYSNTPSNLRASAPPGSQKTATFAAPYEDVFRAATVAATQAQFNVESTDKAAGLILAERVEHGPTLGQQSGERRFFHAIRIRETGPETTELLIVSKAQMECETVGAGMYLNSVFLMIVLIGFVMLPMLISYERECKELAAVHWDTSSMQQMTQLITFTRNNLLAAGVI